MSVLSSGVAPSFVHSALVPGPARLLGSFPTAGYLQLGSGAVIAVLTSDAVQLPIGVTLPWSSAELDLPALAGSGADVVVRPGPELRLGRLRIAVGGRREAALRHCGRPVQLTGPAPSEASDILEGLDRVDPFDEGAVGRLLGRGPGLTPAGDDLLCGALAATVLFGIDCRLAEAVRNRLAEANRVTTSLSRQLLLRAAAGDGLPELQQLGRALCQPEPLPAEAAWRRLLAIGHSSGAALAAGLLAGARHAATSRPVAA